MGFLILLLLIIIGVLAYLLWQKNKQIKRYQGIADVEAEQARIQKESDAIAKHIDKQKREEEEKLNSIAQLEIKLNRLRNIDSLINDQEKLKVEGRAIRDAVSKLKRELGELEDDQSMQEYGLYRPKYDLRTSQDYKARLSKIRQQQKDLVKKNQAVIWGTQWEVQGSKSKGKTMMNRLTKLTLRAFNGECDSIIDKVKYNNVEVIRDRIRKVYEAIDKLNASQNCEISTKYIRLKNEELYLVHEYREKLQEEKEEQRQIREQMREEQRVLKEIEKAQREAQKEEERYQKALVKARQEMEKATGDKHDVLQNEIEKLNAMLEEAQRNKERALSQAQMTKSGHVYIISNIGSFGEDIYKIGMTRRLEPLDRVKELGDASVPFLFDVHAMIYSENAPELEKHLHKAFEPKRVNRINLRKEFFKVSLNEIVNEVHKKSAKVEFTMKAEAEEYRKTRALLTEQEKTPEIQGVAYADVLGM